MAILRNISEDELHNLQEQSNVFVIPCESVPTLYVNLKPYINKANKLDIPFQLEELGMATVDGEPCIVFQTSFIIKNEAWQFIAVIDHMQNGNVIKAFRHDVAIPTIYRTSKNTTCDHCNTKRFRTQTFILYNEDLKQFKQVGRNCLEVYAGIDVSKVLACMDIMNRINDYMPCGSCDADYEEYMSTKPCNYFDLITTLALAWDAVRLFGYAKSGSQNSTKERVCDFYDYLHGDLRKYRPHEHAHVTAILAQHDLKLLNEESKKQAQVIKDFILAQKVNSDYMHNMHVIFENDFVNRKYFGLVVSAVSVYNREQENQKAFKDR